MSSSVPTEVSQGAARHVFVYGTLRRGEANDINRLQPAPVFVGEATVRGTLYRLGWYPGLVLGGQQAVVGEVYAISAELEDRLDEIEGLLPVPTGEYAKRVVSVYMQGQTLDCLLYEINPALLAGRDAMDTGDWLLRIPL